MAGRNAVLSEKVGSEQRNLAGQHIVDGGSKISALSPQYPR
jgi:hypothetical protein